MHSVNRLNDLDTLIAIGMFSPKELKGFISEGLKRLIAVVPLNEQAESINKTFQENAGPTEIIVAEGILANSQLAEDGQPSGKHHTYKIFNLVEANGFKEPTHLKALYPGLRVVNSGEVQILTLPELLNLANTGLVELGRTGIAIYGQGLEQEIYQAINHSDMIANVVALNIRVTENQVYADSMTAQTLAALVEADGFTIDSVSVQDDGLKNYKFSKHPFFDRLVTANQQIQALEEKLVRHNARQKEELEKVNQFKAEQQTKLETLQQELSQAKQKNEDTAARNETLKGELKSARESRDKARIKLEQAAQNVQALTIENADASKKFEEVDSRRKKLKTELESLTGQHQSLSVKSDIQSERIKYLQQQVQQLEDRWAKEKAQESELGTLKKHMDYLFGQSRLQLEQATNALGKHVTTTSDNTRREIESSITLESTYGEHLGRLTGTSTSIRKSVVLALSEKLNQCNYDVIVEFGFSEKTLLIAELLKAKVVNGDSNARLIEHDNADSFDLPHRIVSFEHNKEAYNAGLIKIKENNIKSLVTLTYAPLVNSVHSNEGDLIHDAEHELRRLAELLQGQDKKILVVLTDDEGKPGLYPVLSLMLQVFARHSIELMSCGSTGTIEKLLEQGWKQTLEERDKSYQLERGSNLLHSLIIN